MFRVTFMCDDKRLGEVLRALTGLARGAPVAVPVTNEEVDSKGNIKAKSNGKLVHMFIEHLHKLKTESFTPKDAQVWLKSVGMSPLSSSYVLKAALAAGAVKRTGKSSKSVYHIVKKGG